jgi:hypothetical protein
MLGEHYPVSQIVRERDGAFFTVAFSDTTSARYFASCSRAAYIGVEWATYDREDPDPRIALEPTDSVLFRHLCGPLSPIFPAGEAH